MAITKVGYAQLFAEFKTWSGPCEADFILSPFDFGRVDVAHYATGLYGADYGITPISASTPTASLQPRDPQATTLRYPYTFRRRNGPLLMTGVRDNSHGHCWLYAWDGTKWAAQGSNTPIIYQAGSGDWSVVQNTPMLEMPNGYWLCAPEIGGGIGIAVGSDWWSLTKSTGVVIAGAGNGYLDNFRDTHAILWAGQHDSTGHWFTTIYSRSFADIMSNKNGAWTDHSASFKIYETSVHICDPSVMRVGDRSLFMVSYNQAGMKMYEGPDLDRMYALLLGV